MWEWITMYDSSVELKLVSKIICRFQRFTHSMFISVLFICLLKNRLAEDYSWFQSARDTMLFSSFLIRSARDVILFFHADQQDIIFRSFKTNICMYDRVFEISFSLCYERFISDSFLNLSSFESKLKDVVYDDQWR